jgi:hypothetical protein
VGPYIHQLTNKYMIFIFLLLPVLAVSPDGEPPKQAKYTTHSSKIFNIVHDNRKENKFDNSRQLFDKSRQFKIQMKLKLCCRVIAAGSSGGVQEGVDVVVSRPTALL